MQFLVKSSPHIRANDGVPQIMRHVMIAMLPAVVYSVILFGTRVIMLYVLSVGSCLVFEVLVKVIRKRPIHIEDTSAGITGVLLVMTLPPATNSFMVVIGSGVAIIFAKEVFGGLGNNIFNPALVGRAFLQVAFPAEMVKYTSPIRVPFNILGNINDAFLLGADAASSATIESIDLVNALTQSTPLSFMKYTYAGQFPVNFFEQIKFESSYYLQMFIGNTAGAIGETSFLLLFIGGIMLIIMKVINWRIPLGMTLSLVCVNLIMNIVNPGVYPTPIYSLLAGGFALGAFFMATDMVTCPSSNKGIWVYAVLIGAVIAILRGLGSSTEYVMYSILIGNMFVPLITMYVKTKPLGKKEAELLNKESAGSK